MGYAIYTVSIEGVERDAGYGVPCFCDHPGCTEVIDRGLAYLCGMDPGETESGCGRYFCEKHLPVYRSRPESHHICSQCAHSRKPWPMKPDHPTWIHHKLTDPSWGDWRAENPALVASVSAPAPGATT